MEKIIIGGGMVGRLALLLTGGVAAEVKREKGTEIFGGLYYLHATDIMDTVLKMMGLSAERIPIKGGVFWYKNLISFEELNGREQLAIVDSYCQKTRGVYWEDLPDNDSVSVMGGVMSNKQSEKYKVTYEEFWRALCKITDSRIMYGLKLISALDISNGVITLADHKNKEFVVSDYGQSIITVPLKGLFNKPTPELTFDSSHFYVFGVSEWARKFDGYDFVYLPGADIDGDRLVFDKDGTVILETRKADTKKALETIMRLGALRCKILYKGTNKYKQLYGNPQNYIDEIEKDGRNKLLGRYAEWDNSLLVNHVVERLVTT